MGILSAEWKKFITYREVYAALALSIVMALWGLSLIHIYLSILLSTHDFATLDQYADKVLLLKHQILKVGPPAEVLA